MDIGKKRSILSEINIVFNQTARNGYYFSIDYTDPVSGYKTRLEWLHHGYTKRQKSVDRPAMVDPG